MYNENKICPQFLKFPQNSKQSVTDLHIFMFYYKDKKQTKDYWFAFTVVRGAECALLPLFSMQLVVLLANLAQTVTRQSNQTQTLRPTEASLTSVNIEQRWFSCQVWPLTHLG